MTQACNQLDEALSGVGPVGGFSAMEASDVRSAAVSAMSQVHARAGRGPRWSVASDELFWVFELDRGRSWSPWTLTLGCAVRAWLIDDVVVPPVNRCHVLAEYSLLPEGVPAQAAHTRFDDHRSYFTMAFDHTHDRMDDEQRRQAFDFMAANLREVTQRISTEHALRDAVAAGYFAAGFVDRQLSH